MTGWFPGAANDSVSIRAEGLPAEASERIAPLGESSETDPQFIAESRSRLIKLYETLGQSERRTNWRAKAASEADAKP